MHNELSSLIKLQEVDLQTLEIRTQLEAIPKELDAMRTDVQNVGDILEREMGRLAEAEEWRVEREKEIAFQTELLTKSKVKLQASRNEKEHSAAQREIDTIRKNIQEREEEAFKVLEAMEHYRTAIDEHGKEFAELEQHLNEREEESRKKMAELEESIARTSGNRSELASKVPQRTLRLYERIHKRLGKAVVDVENGSCTGCYIALPPQLHNEVLKGDKLFQCPICHRIVVCREQGEPDQTEATEG